MKAVTLQEIVLLNSNHDDNIHPVDVVNSVYDKVLNRIIGKASQKVPETNYSNQSTLEHWLEPKQLSQAKTQMRTSSCCTNNSVNL